MSQIIYNISIEPIMTNGETINGKYLLLNGTQRIDTINFQIAGNVQRTMLSNAEGAVLFHPEGPDYESSNGVYSPIKITSLHIPNNIFDPTGQATMTVVINSNQGRELFASPFCDLFRAGDIVRISYTAGSDFAGLQQPGLPQQIFVGAIEDPIEINSDLSGTYLTIHIGFLPNILARSQLVQTQSNQQINGTVLTSIIQQYQFGELITKLINETYISQTVTSIEYYQGVTNNVVELLAQGKPDVDNPTTTSGSAIFDQSWVFAVTTPTDTKLNCLLQILYPYQRIFYVAPSGNFVITPLSSYFDPTEDWRLDLFGDATAIPLLGISLRKNTATLQNRAYCTFNQFFTEFNLSDATGSISAAPYSIATPPQSIFPRAYDFVKSTLGLQTLFDIEAVDSNILQNSGILNTAVNITNNVVGMKCLLNIDNQNTHITSSDIKLNAIKYLMSLYASRKLAESLVQDMLVNVSMPTISTYSPTLKRFRNIPLNQMVKVPDVYNNNFDGQTELFCYGFSLDWNMEQGSITTLNLCKPYVFTALWCDQTSQIEV